MAWRMWIATVCVTMVFSVMAGSSRAAEPGTPPEQLTTSNGAVGEKEVGGEPAQQVEFFQAKADGLLEVKFIAKNDHAARVVLRNTTNRQMDVKLPEAFAGIPVLAQFGGGGFGGGGRGGGRGGGGFGGGGMGGGSQGMGGGMGGMGGGGMGGMGGGGGFFSIPPEKVRRIDLPVVCLDHGKKDPSSSMPYEIVPVDEYVDRPEVVHLLKAFGYGELQHAAAQAATWHLNNDLSWSALAAKRKGTRRSFTRPPYFSRQELQAAVAYSDEARRRAQHNPSALPNAAAGDSFEQYQEAKR